tara:strand:+ start:714 stop:1139 length:426 start_codon:yes stop_codon:yes gene_type:complete
MTNDRPKIYLVDDHKSFTVLTKHVVNNYFESECDIDIYEDSEIALNKIISNPNGLDYLFLDLAMPKLNGWDFIEELKKKLELESLSFDIIIITGSEANSDMKQASRLNCVTHFINKPLSLDKVNQIFKSSEYLKNLEQVNV